MLVVCVKTGAEFLYYSFNLLLGKEVLELIITSSSSRHIIITREGYYSPSFYCLTRLANILWQERGKEGWPEGARIQTASERSLRKNIIQKQFASQQQS